MSTATVLSLIGIVASFFMVVKRDMVADMIGEADWMRKVGGVHYFVVFCAILIFFLSLATLTGTSDLLLSPIKYLFTSFSGQQQQPTQPY